jgi:hypothetical protein
VHSAWLWKALTLEEKAWPPIELQAIALVEWTSSTGCLHGSKNLAEAAALECSGEVMEDCMVGVILLENTKEVTVHSIDKGIANLGWEFQF